MRFGLALPQYDFSLPGAGKIEWPFVRDWAQKAEDLGFDSIWLSDHLFLDVSKYGGPPDPQAAMECFTTLAALALTTNQVRLGSLVVCNDLRAPAVVAKLATGISLLSGGRFELGIGAGWYEPEFTATGINFDRPGVRIARMAEAVQIIRGMAADDCFSFEGAHYRMKDAWNLPRSPDPAFPVWVGGKGDKVVSVAAYHADGFNTVWAWSPERYGGRIAILEEKAHEAGRDPAEIRRSVGLNCLPASDDSQFRSRWERYVFATPPGVGEKLDPATWGQDKLAGTPDQMVSTLRAFEAFGVEEVILNFGLIPFSICDASAVEDFASEVKPLLN